MAQTNLVGKTVMGYKVIEKLGSGAFGTVYKVKKTNVSGDYVRALKHITIPTTKQYNSVVNSMGGDISKVNSYFKRSLDNIVSEIQILNNLSEKGVQNIVRYYENDIVVTENPRRYDIYILMEYLIPLEDYMKKKDFLMSDVIRLALDLLNGIKSCHDNGVIHRDIKDDNIFVTGEGRFKIGDFGVSKVLKDSSKAESIKGTPNFLAPEVYLGKEGYTKNVDLYSLGIVLYRLLNHSRNPFLPHYPEQYLPEDEDAAFEKRMKGETPDFPDLGGKEIGRVIVKAISKNAERYQSADEFTNDLKLAIKNTPKEVFQEKVILNSSSDDKTIEIQKYATILGEKNREEESERSDKNDPNRSLNRYLFESYDRSEQKKEPVKTEPERVEPVKREPEKKKIDLEDKLSFLKDINIKDKLSFLNKKIMMIVGLVVVLAGAGFITYNLFFGKTKIHLLENIEVTFSGSDGNGYVQSLSLGDIDYDKSNHQIKDFIESIEVEYDFEDYTLSNGDEVTFTAVYDETLAKEMDLNIKDAKVTITVDGLVERYETASDVPDLTEDDIKTLMDEYVYNQYDNKATANYTYVSTYKTMYQAYDTDGDDDYCIGIYEIAETYNGAAPSTEVYYIYCYIYSVNEEFDVNDPDCYEIDVRVMYNGYDKVKDLNEVEDALADSFNTHELSEF